MLLTEAQLHAIKQIIENHHSAFIVNTIGPKAVAESVLEELKKQGLVSLSVSSIQDAYMYGQVLAAMQNPKAATMSYDEFRQWVQKNPVPLSATEQQAVNMAQMNAAQYVRGLGNRVDVATGQILIEADSDLRNRMKAEIINATAENIAKRESVKELKSALGWATSDWARDWGRIAATEKHNAMQTGMADHLTKKFGPDVLVAKRPMPDACNHCKRLHLGPDGMPRIFKLSTLEKFGTNVGRKAIDWKPTVGTVHPWCQCQLIRIPAGWGFDEDGDLVPAGKLGEKYEDPSDLEMSLAQEHDLRKSIESGEDRLEFQGLSIFIENTVGSVRSWRDAEGGTGQTKMLHAYGYIEGVAGDDGDELDCFVGPDPRAQTAYLMDQQNPANGIYDERKVMLGFSNEDDAVAAYQQHYTRPDFLVSVSPMEMEAFKRWIKMAPVQKSVSTEPRLVILEKGNTTPEAAVSSSTHTADSKAPSMLGTGVNYYFKAPKKEPSPTLEEDGHDIDANDILRPKEKRKAIKRDKRIYDMINPGKKPVVKINTFTDRDHVGTPIGTGWAEHNREWLDAYDRSMKGVPNKSEVKKSDVRFVLSKGTKGPQAPTHKYTERIWMQDHWLYKYVGHHGGKIRGHHTSLEHIVMKLPTDKANELTKLKKQYGLSGDVIMTSQYAILPISQKDAAYLKLHDKNAAKTITVLKEKKPAKGKKAAKPPSPAIQSKDIKIIKSLEEVDRKTMSAPPTYPNYLHNGHKVEVNGQPGTVYAFDLDGIGVVKLDNGKRVKAAMKDLKPLGDTSYVSTYDRLAGGKVYKLDTRAQSILDKALSVEPIAGHSFSSATDSLRKHGAEVFLIGGMVRDLLADTAIDGAATDEDILAKMNDMDIVTTANPRAAHVVAKEMIPDYSQGKISESIKWGVILLQDFKGGPGLDIATVAIEGAHSNTKEEEVLFDHDLDRDMARRDFTVNSLYYDPYNQVVIDPSGTGLADAQNHVLRIPPMTKEEQYANKSLPYRYFKFRGRGFRPEAETLTKIREQVAAQFTEQSQDALWGELKRAFFRKGKTFGPTMKLVEDVMRSDGMGDLYDEHVAPHKAYLLSRYKAKDYK